MKIVAYYRVSTKKQKASGLGIEAQKLAINDFAARNRGKVIAEYTEAESGKRDDRPKLTEAIAHAKLAKATLVVAKLDRLARNVQFTSTLMNSGVEFIAVDNPNANRLTIHILAAVAEDEALSASRRTKDALAAAKANGKLLGSARPDHWKGREHLRGGKKGAKVAAKLRTERAMAAYAFLLPSMLKMKHDEGLGCETIAKRLNDAGHLTTYGRPFNPATVWRIFKRAGEKSAPVGRRAKRA